MKSLCRGSSLSGITLYWEGIRRHPVSIVPVVSIPQKFRPVNFHAACYKKFTFPQIPKEAGKPLWGLPALLF